MIAWQLDLQLPMQSVPITIPGPVSSTKKTDGHDIAEILLKVALSTIKQTNKHFINNIINVRRLTIYLFYFIQCITLK
jgi:hypothetical protein